MAGKEESIEAMSMAVGGLSYGSRSCQSQSVLLVYL